MIPPGPAHTILAASFSTSATHLDPVELLFQPVECVVADLLLRPHVEDDLPGCGNRSAVNLFMVLEVSVSRIGGRMLQMRAQLVAYGPRRL